MLHWTVKWENFKRNKIKNFVAQDSVLKLNPRFSFYYRYPEAEMAWNKSRVLAILAKLTLDNVT